MSKSNESLLYCYFNKSFKDYSMYYPYTERPLDPVQHVRLDNIIMTWDEFKELYNIEERDDYLKDIKSDIAITAKEWYITRIYNKEEKYNEWSHYKSHRHNLIYYQYKGLIKDLFLLPKHVCYFVNDKHYRKHLNDYSDLYNLNFLK